MTHLVSNSRTTSDTQWEAKDQRRAKRFGLTREQYTELINRHGGVCPIHKGRSKDLVVDHCHSSGNVRDLICRTCNTEVGWVEKGRTDIKRPFRPEVLAYVARWNAVHLHESRGCA